MLLFLHLLLLLLLLILLLLLLFLHHQLLFFFVSSSSSSPSSSSSLSRSFIPHIQLHFARSAPLNKCAYSSDKLHILIHSAFAIKLVMLLQVVLALPFEEEGPWQSSYTEAEPSQSFSNQAELSVSSAAKSYSQSSKNYEDVCQLSYSKWSESGITILCGT